MGIHLHSATLATAKETMKYFCLYHHKASLEQQKHKEKPDSNQVQGWREDNFPPGQGSEHCAQQHLLLGTCASGSSVVLLLL